MNVKLIFSVLASVIAIVAYYPYIRDIFQGKTKPHIYTWLIWGITSGVATAGLWYGGGGMGVVGLGIISSLVIFVFLLSFRYGTKNITRSDTVILLIALSSVIVWWYLDSPILAVLMVTLIDVFGYLPTYRKSWDNPYEETLLFWVLIVISSPLIIMSNTEYNLLTMSYVTAMFIVDSILVGILFYRRKVLKNNN